jgi:hypothetical protein
MIYRITGRTTWYDHETKSWIAGDRVTVRRARSYDHAYYEDLPTAKRGLAGFQGNARTYTDLRIESTEAEWVTLAS